MQEKGPNMPYKPLRKQAYPNILKILPPKNKNFQTKILIFVVFLLKIQIVGTC